MQLFRLLAYVWKHPLNARGRLSAIGRVAKWQIGSRLLPGAVALPYVGGTRLFATRGMWGATGNWYCGLHEVAEMAFVLHVLRPSDKFIDVGANVGSYTVLAAGAVGSRVFAVEPIPTAFGSLRRNVELNGLGERVLCWQGGLSDRRTTLRFSSELDTVNHVLAVDEDQPNIEVPVTTLDDLVGEDVPTVIKIDVEGHELPVLRGGQRVLADRRLWAVIMETNGSGARYGVEDQELFEVMHQHEFVPYCYEPFKRQLFAGRSDSGNTVFVRDINAVSERIRTAPMYALINGSI